MADNLSELDPSQFEVFSDTDGQFNAGDTFGGGEPDQPQGQEAPGFHTPEPQPPFAPPQTQNVGGRGQQPQPVPTAPSAHYPPPQGEQHGSGTNSVDYQKIQGPFAPAVASYQAFNDAKATAMGLADGFFFEFFDDMAVKALDFKDYITGKDMPINHNREYVDKIRQEVIDNSSPYVYDAANLGGSVISPINKVFGAVPVLGKAGAFMGKMAAKSNKTKWASSLLKNVPENAAGAGLTALGMRDDMRIPRSLEEFSDQADTFVKGGLIGSASSAAFSGTLKAAKGTLKYAAKSLDNPELREKIVKSVAGYFGSLPPHFRDYIWDNPHLVDPDKVSGVNEFSGEVVDALNKTRVYTNSLYKEMNEMLRDEPQVSVTHLKGLITRLIDKTDTNKSSSTFKKLQALKEKMNELADTRLREFHEDRFSRLGLEASKTELRKISTRGARNILKDFTEEFHHIKSESLKMAPFHTKGNSIHKTARWRVHKWIADTMPKADAKRYMKLANEQAENEALLQELYEEIPVRKPDMPEWNEMLKGEAADIASRRDKLQPGKNINEKLGGKTVKQWDDEVTKKLAKLDDVLALTGDDSLSAQLKAVRVNYRTNGGETNGSRNTKMYSALGGALGIASSYGLQKFTTDHDEPMSHSMRGYATGAAIGAGIGFLLDKTGRRFAKNVIRKYAKKAGGTLGLDAKLSQLGDEGMIKFIRAVRKSSKTNAGGSLAYNILMKRTPHPSDNEESSSKLGKHGGAFREILSDESSYIDTD